MLPSLLLLLPLAAATPQMDFQIPGASHWDGMGMGTFVLNDYDGDGYNEFGSSALCSDHNGTNSGSVYIYDGATRTLLRRHDGDGRSDRLGRRAVNLGDLDQDGWDDYASGTSFETRMPCTRVRCTSGVDRLVSASPN